MRNPRAHVLMRVAAALVCCTQEWSPSKCAGRHACVRVCGQCLYGCPKGVGRYIAQAISLTPVCLLLHKSDNVLVALRRRANHGGATSKVTALFVAIRPDCASPPFNRGQGPSATVLLLNPLSPFISLEHAKHTTAAMHCEHSVKWLLSLVPRRATTRR